MTSKQYEELCRFFLSEQLGVPVERILSIHIENPRRPGLPKYDHQIDLYWEAEDKVALYLNIANAKWRGSRSVEQGDVLLLQQVRADVGAHKALLLTNTSFTAGAEAAGKHHGIGLHVVQPNFDYGSLHPSDAGSIQAALRQAAAKAQGPLYQHRIIHKSFDLADLAAGTPLARPTVVPPPPVPAYSDKSMRGYQTKAGGPAPGAEGRPLGPGRRGPGGFGFRTK